MKKKAKNYGRLLSILLAAALAVTGCTGEVGSESADGSSGVSDRADTAASPADTQAESGEYTKALAQRSQSSADSDPTITSTLSQGDGSRGGEAAEKSCTVMIYMVGSNLESRLGNATKDLEEIDEAGLNCDDYNVIVYTGGSSRWVGNVPCDHNCVLDLSLGEDERIVAQTQGNADMGLPQTLTAFLNYCAENYPARHNMLILWDHGGGPLWGYGMDELYDSDSLLLDEMKSAMDASAFCGGQDGKKLDIVGFDACLMASLECMSIWKDYADYYVGSEELEPGDGWNYAFLNVLDENDDWKTADSDGFAQIIGDSILTSFASYYDERRSDNYNPDLTLAYTDLRGIDALNEALDALANKMADGVEGGDYASLMQDRSQVKSFGMTKDSGGDASFYYDLVDMGNLAEHMASFYPQEAAAVSEALEAAVAGNYSNIDSCTGMTLYYPYKNKGQFDQLGEYYANFLKTEGYSRFLELTGSRFLSDKSWDWTLGAPEDQGDEYTLQLSQEQLDNMTEAAYSVLVPGGSMGGYIPYMENCKIEPDKDGIIHLDKNLPLAVLKTSDTAGLLRVEQTESDRKREVYSTKGISLRSDLLMNSRITDLEHADATIRLIKDKKSGETQIQNIELQEGSEGISGGKNSVDLMEWEGLAILAEKDFLAPARDGEGRILPYSEWTRPGDIVWNTVPVCSQVELELMDSDELELPEGTICQIEIRDLNGERYAAEPVLIPGAAVEEQKVTVGDGELVFFVYDDHAELSSYSGRETRVEVPAQVGGVPVTVIGSSAFSKLQLFDLLGYDPVAEVVLPDTVTDIRSEAFAYCRDLRSVTVSANLRSIGHEAFLECSSLEEIDLPDSVERIGKCAFASCRSLTQFRIPQGLVSLDEGAFMDCVSLTKFTGGTKASGTPSGTANFPVLDKDGAIYSGDGAVLLAYPDAAGEQFTVKEGTKEIGYGAFDGASLKEVVLPEGLTKIGNNAFYNCTALRAPVFPDGLLRLGMHSFDVASMVYEPEDLPTQQEVISIPASLEHIGAHALDKFLNVRFEVSENNRHYSAVDGALMNKAGDTLYYVATDPGCRAVFPEGTVEFSEEPLQVYEAMNIFSNSVVKQIYLPQSMTKFPDGLYDYQNIDNYALYHCPAGSEAEKFVLSMGLLYTNDTEKAQDSLEIATEKGTLYFDLYSDHAVLQGYSGEDEVLEIPSEAGGRNVTEIGNGTEPLFTNHSFLSDTGRKSPNLTRIVIPEGVTSINASALSDCNYNTAVTFPSTLRRLGKNAASGVSSFESLPDGLEILEENCLSWPIDLPFVVKPQMHFIDRSFSSYICSFEQEGENDTYSVRDGALCNADGTVLFKYPSGSDTEEFSIPEGTIFLGDSSFYSCGSLAKVHLPASLKQIGENAFSYCSKLTQVSCDEGTELESIGAYAFAYCDSLSEISLPPTDQIMENAFSYSRSLEKVHLADGCREIGDHAFSNTAVAAPEFPDSLVKIGSYVYTNNDSTVLPGSADLIRIPANVSSIGTNTFVAIGNTEFEVDPENPFFSSQDGLLLDKHANTLYMCASAVEGLVTVPDTVTSIGFGAFDGAHGVTDVEIPDSVIYISSGTFNPIRVDDGNGGYKQVYPVTLHCSAGSYAEKFAVSRGIPHEIKE